ncbi:ADP,ATP carrier protein 2 [Dictyocoela muelleri]|nr:ADP,ATP carrier protein 2 [Dictyocoela muelleri]
MISTDRIQKKSENLKKVKDDVQKIRDIADFDNHQIQNKNKPLKESELTIEELEILAEKNKTFFGAIRIAPCEKTKIGLISLIFGIIIFIYSLMREFKDAFMMDSQSIIAIYYMKMIIIPIVVFVVMAILHRLYFYYDNEIILKYTFLGFGIYFIFYGTLIFPFRKFLEPNAYYELDMFSDDQMKYKGGNLLLAIITIILRWTSTLHFIISELWGSTVLSILFMSFIIDICHIQQFSRFLPLLTILGNIGRVVSALFTFGYGKFTNRVEYKFTNYIISGFFIIFAILSFYMFYLIRHLIAKYPVNLRKEIKSIAKNDGDVKSNRDHEKTGLVGSLKIIIKSKFAAAMCFIVLTYSIILCMVEALQKASMQACATENNSDIISHVLSVQWLNQLLTALILIFLLLSPFQRLIEYSGWLSMAIIPPIVSLIAITTLTIVSFVNTCSADKCNFSFLISLSAKLRNLFPFLSVEWEQWIATITLILFKVLKYGPFDISKDIIGRRIDDTHRSRLKSVYDGIFGNIGKSLGSILTIGISFFFDSSDDIRDSSLFYLSIAVLFIFYWILTIFYLSKKYNDAVARNSTIDIH